jgi:hypothetical protein
LNPKFGISVTISINIRSVSSAGDVNGDGVDDLIVGAYGANLSDKIDAGKSYVIFGKQDKLVSVLTCSMNMHCRPIEQNNAQFMYATKIISFAIKK